MPKQEDFTIWYDNPDVEKIVWSMHAKLSPEQKKEIFDPYVFFDSNHIPFEEMMSVCKNSLLNSDKVFFPFIIKPEVGSAHYEAGFLRKDSADSSKVSLFLFNPVGYPNAERARNRLGLKDAERVKDMPFIFSTHAVQSAEKDGGVLVSCGPLCVELMNHMLNDVGWMRTLDKQFKLPEELSQFTEFNEDKNKEKGIANYQKEILLLRARDHDILTKISVNAEAQIEEFYAPMTEELLNKCYEPEDDDQSEYEYPDDDDQSEYEYPDDDNEWQQEYSTEESDDLEIDSDYSSKL